MQPVPSPAFDIWRIFFARPAHAEGLAVQWSEPAQPGWSGAVVRKVTLPAGAWCLKGLPAREFEAPRLRELHRLTAWLAQQGVSPLAVPLTATTGVTCVEEAGWLWQCEPWLPGVPAAVSQVSPRQVEQAVRLVAEWHLAVTRYQASTAGRTWFDCNPAGSPPGLPERLERWRAWPPDRCRKALIQLAHAHSPGVEWSPLASRVVRVALQEGSRLEAELRGAGSLHVPLLPCLRDVWRPHLLFTGERLTGLIDLQACRTETVAADLGRLLGSLAPRRPDLWRVGLTAYEEVRPLSASERLLIPVYDRSGCLLAALNWVEWLLSRLPTIRGTGAEAAAAARLAELGDRLEHGLPGEAWSM